MLKIIDRHNRFLIYGPTNEEQVTELTSKGVQTKTDPESRTYVRLKRPTTYGTLTVGTASTYRTTQALYFDVDPSGTYLADEKITQAATGAVGKVVEWDSTNSILYYIQTRHNDEGLDSNRNQTILR